VEYESVDVRDPAALSAAVRGVYDRHGRIDGVIHGAGVIEDKLIADKTLESFDRVVETKVIGALALTQCLRLDELKFLAFMSSVSGRFGNEGQADYAAANEILNKLARHLDAACPGQMFTSPTPDQMLDATQAVDGGAGVLHIVKNYTGDVLNFEAAAEMAQAEGLEVESVVIDDDVAVKDSLFTAGRRGVGATVLAEKICGKLTVHAQIEEEIFYPEVRKAIGKEAGASVTVVLAERV